jgi:hypothetical protein
MIPGPRVFLRNPGRHQRRASRILVRMSRARDLEPLILEEAEDDDAR